MRQNSLPANVAQILSKSVEKSLSLNFLRHTWHIFEVERGNGKIGFCVVNLQTRSCSCGFFKEYGIPCSHMCRVLLAKRVHPKTFVVPERRRQALLATYTGSINPVDLTNLQDDGLKPPEQTKRRGRPKEKRYISASEKGPRRKVTCGL